MRPAQAGPFLSPTEEDRAEARRRLPRFTLGDAASLAEALLAVLGEEAPQQRLADVSTGPPAVRQRLSAPPPLPAPNVVAQPVQAATPGGFVSLPGAQGMLPPRLLLPAPDAVVQSTPPASLPSVGQQHLPGQNLLPPPPVTLQPGSAAMPPPYAGMPAMQPVPGQPLPWSLGPASMPPPSTRPAVAGPLPPAPPVLPPPELSSLPLPAPLPGTYAGSLPLQQHFARPAALAGSVTPAADSNASLQPHAATSPGQAAAAADTVGDALAVPEADASDQQQLPEVPAPMDIDAAHAPPAPMGLEAPTLQQQVTAVSGEAAGGTVSAASEPPPAPATVLSEGRAAALSALDRALGILPPSAALDGSAVGAQSAVLPFGTPAWLPSPHPLAAFSMMRGLGPPLSIARPPGQAPPFQLPAVGGTPGGAQAAVTGVRGLIRDRGAVMAEEVRRLRADMAARARAQEERERRLAEVLRSSAACPRPNPTSGCPSLHVPVARRACFAVPIHVSAAVLVLICKIYVPPW